MPIQRLCPPSFNGHQPIRIRPARYGPPVEQRPRASPNRPDHSCASTLLVVTKWREVILAAQSWWTEVNDKPHCYNNDIGSHSCKNDLESLITMQSKKHLGQHCCPPRHCCIYYYLFCPADVIACDVKWRTSSEFWCTPKSAFLQSGLHTEYYAGQRVPTLYPYKGYKRVVPKTHHHQPHLPTYRTTSYYNTEEPHICLS
jgi:hypothetical protein